MRQSHTTRLEVRDIKLKNLLNSLSNTNKDFWSFSRKATVEHAHTYMQYPAMMVPQMLEELLDALQLTVPSISIALDPFMGSGTSMTESMLKGINFIGKDINPLAYLLCSVKSGPFYYDSLRRKVEQILKRAKMSSSRKIDISFPGLSKWFHKEVSFDLSIIRRLILEENSRWARNFFWIALAETIRLTSNSRTSTFKLHIRTKEELNDRRVDTKKIFESILRRNLNQLNAIRAVLMQKGLLKKGKYIGFINLHIGDSTNQITLFKNELCDFLITSPPYGDNKTTVPYGQYSYLALQWIKLTDIHPKLNSSILSSTHTLDSMSFGGSLKNAFQSSVTIQDKSPTLKKIIKSLKSKPIDRANRVAAFFSDFDKSLDPTLKILKPNAYMFWIIGNRKVGGLPIPFDKILIELLQNRGASHLVSIRRIIPSKRMAIRNNITDTMRSETIVVLRKNGGHK